METKTKLKVGRPKKELPDCTGCTNPDPFDAPEGRTHQAETKQHPEMIKALAAEAKDKLEDHHLHIHKTSETYTIKRREFSFKVEISSEHIRILNSNGSKDFVFASKNSPETIDRWGNVVAMLCEAIKLIKSKRKLEAIHTK